jgi:hypothetical protein
MTMMTINRSARIAIASVALAGIWASMLAAGPAQATSLTTASTARTVERAERALGLDDDRVPDAVSISDSGETVDVPLEDVDLQVRTGEAARDPESSVRYTSDQLSTTSVRLAAVLPSADHDTATWDFGSSVELFQSGDGRVTVSDHDGELLAGIDAPWAVDAAGVPVASTYSVNGSTLTQHIDVSSSTVYPVVADPKFTSFPGYWTATFNRSESASVVGTVATCAAVLAKSPVPALRALTVACGGLAAFSGAQLAGGKCVKVHVAGAPPLVGTWWPTFPKC